MRLPNMILAGLLALGGALLTAQAGRLPAPAERAAGAPGTPTPQPFSQPLPRNLPSTAPNNPPLLNDGTGYKGGRFNPRSDNLAPPDTELPLLQEQLRRNTQGLPPGRRGAD